MSIINFLFLGFVLISNLIFLILGEVSIEVQVVFSTVLICLFGIPHGAIDHIIYRQEQTRSALMFYSFYFGLILVYFAIWMYLPILSMLLFLTLSAFHFGQSQFSNLAINLKWQRVLLYQSWGLSILSGLVIFNYDQIYILVANNQDTVALMPAFQYQANLVVLVLSSAVTLAILIHLKVKNRISGHSFFKEILLFGLIHLCFFTLPLLVGFTIYFSTLHSMQVLLEEFGYLKKKMLELTVSDFVYMILPYTLVSIVGLGALLIMSFFGILSMSATFLVFIVISILTLPHSIVMDDFYFKSLK
ncbi:Brp/Blh family beta-carotene 15,15'-dioxygenase [Bacteroidia bacterium]|nr:Brp/Blh family beta-carotene 15,15'-dioxygenase [Bacteroidia bacterium]MDB9881552.1 Brp/Blh family beta-carotene 15,15'-dioxygenase [Bacteroidia bacterium]